MSILAEAAETATQLPIPAIAYGIIAAVVFVVLGFVTFSFRDVYHRHIEKSNKQSGGHH